MGVGIIGPQGVTPVSPPAREPLVKIGKIVAGDSSTGFAAFGLPKYAFICGVDILATGLNATQTITAGITASGTEFLTTYTLPASTGGYDTCGTAAGSLVGTQLTDDVQVFLKASAALTNPVYVMVKYWVPPVGQSY